MRRALLIGWLGSGRLVFAVVTLLVLLACLMQALGCEALNVGDPFAPDVKADVYDLSPPTTQPADDPDPLTGLMQWLTGGQ